MSTKGPTMIEYLVTHRLSHEGKMYKAGERLSADPAHLHANVQNWLDHGWLRHPTDLEGGSAPVPQARAAKGDPAPPPVSLSDAIAPEAVQLLPTLFIAPGPFNPRRRFDPESLAELGESIAAQGLIQPIVVRPVPRGAWSVEQRTDGGKATHWIFDTRRKLTMFPREIMEISFATAAAAVAALPRFEIVAGERRWRACRIRGIVGIPAIVRDVDDVTAGEQRLVENGQREDVSPLEEAEAYEHMLSLPGYDVDRLAAKVGKQKSSIYARLALLKLPEPAQKAVAEGKLAPSTAELITRLETPDAQAKATKMILGGDAGMYAPTGDTLSVKEAKAVVTRISHDETVAGWEKEAIAAGIKAGLTMLTGKAADGIVRWADTVNPTCGYVVATDSCPRDPRGRTWREVLPESAFHAGEKKHVVRYGVVVHPRVGKPKPVEIYQREQVNQALKALGLWQAEGSKATLERERREREKHEAGLQREAMMRDMDAIAVHAARDRNPRRALLATVWAATCDRNHCDAAEFVAKRRAWISLDDTESNAGGVVRSKATDMPVADLQALVVELAIAQIGWEESYYEDGRDEMRELLEMEYQAGEGEESAPKI